MSKRFVFVTGTDTGVGKTVFTLSFIRALQEKGRAVGAVKPIETGAGTDARQLQDAIGVSAFVDVCPYYFSPAVSPHIAAKMAGVEIMIKDVSKKIKQAAGDVIVIEGAGGVLVPFNANDVFADLVATMGGELIVVVGSKLGCINHAALTFESIKHRKLNCLGYVFNELSIDSSDESKSTNRESVSEIAKQYGFSELGYVPLLGPSCCELELDSLLAHF